MVKSSIDAKNLTKELSDFLLSQRKSNSRDHELPKELDPDNDDSNSGFSGKKDIGEEENNNDLAPEMYSISSWNIILY